MTYLQQSVNAITSTIKFLLLAYEQAFELATDGGQKSHVRAAMGMLGYMSGEIDGCKLALCER